jgi:hypothetical protein
MLAHSVHFKGLCHGETQWIVYQKAILRTATANVQLALSQRIL